MFASQLMILSLSVVSVCLVTSMALRSRQICRMIVNGVELSTIAQPGVVITLIYRFSSGVVNTSEAYV